MAKMMTTARDVPSELDDVMEAALVRARLDAAVEVAFAAVGVACEMREKARAVLDVEESRRADMRLGNLAMMHDCGFDSDGCGGAK